MKTDILAHAEKYLKDFKDIEVNTKKDLKKALSVLTRLHKKYQNDREGLQHLRLALESLINKLRVNGMIEEEKELIKFLNKI